MGKTGGCENNCAAHGASGPGRNSQANEMQPDYAALVRRKLGEIQSSDPKERQALYQRTRKALSDYFKRNGHSAREYEFASQALKTAIDTVEAEYGENERALHGLHQFFEQDDKTPEPTRLDKFIHSAGSLTEVLKSKYGFAAGIVSFLGDISKPIIDLTIPMMIGSAIAAIAAYTLRIFLKTNRREAGLIGAFCAVLFACSGAWLGLQNFIPGARANGAVAQVVPGVSALQDIVVTSLGRIESQTRRVGDLIEENAKREREENERAKKAQQDFLLKQRQATVAKLQDAGYTPDSAGMMLAAMNGYSNMPLFEQLGVKPTKDAIAIAFARSKNINLIAQLRQYIVFNKDNHSLFRQAIADLSADSRSARSAYRGRNTKKELCEPKTYQLAPSDLLQTMCTAPNGFFAALYSSFYNVAYQNLNDDGRFVQPLQIAEYHAEAPDMLSAEAVKVSEIVPSTMNQCQIYEGNLRYFEGAGLLPWGTYENDDPRRTSYFSAADPRFKENSITCVREDIIMRRSRQCVARVIMFSPCVALVKEPMVVKVLVPTDSRQGSPVNLQSAPPERQPAAGPAHASDKPLSQRELQSLIIGRNLSFGGPNNVLMYHPNGTLDGGDGRFGFQGRYRTQANGTICGTMGPRGEVCLQFYRRDGLLRVRRTNGFSPGDIGLVTAR
ncbi:MAG: hypothetical protein GC182_12715 [Rhodopseudomonas sp.]|nr:hypothetical protein [Rhodopseudomonas sp.]